MNERAQVNIGKFSNPQLTATGEPRATVALKNPKTLWFNTGTLCNIECENCYIASSPSNDALVYITADEVRAYLDQLIARQWNVTEIAFTGGEPFMNPQIIDICEAALAAGYDVLVLTNAMRPMMRKKMQQGLIRLNTEFPGKLTLRISVDHYQPEIHDAERGAGSFEKTLEGMKWLSAQGLAMHIAGRSVFGVSEADSRAGYHAFFQQHGFEIDAQDPSATVLFPEMDETVEVPEITTSCWDILGKSPDSVMCASSRMVIKRKGAQSPSVLACTLLPYAPEFELGETLKDAEKDVALNHPHCAKFCVLGGASCSA